MPELGNQLFFGMRHGAITILPSDASKPCTPEPRNLPLRPDWLPIFGNPKWGLASLTGGIQFVTVNQSLTRKPLAGAKFCRQLRLQTSRNLRFWSQFR